MFEALEVMRMDLQIQRLGEDADHHFHYAIARATHNKFLFRLMNTIELLYRGQPGIDGGLCQTQYRLELYEIQREISGQGSGGSQRECHLKKSPVQTFRRWGGKP